MSEYSQALRLAYEAVRGTYKQFTAKNVSLLNELLVEGVDFYAIEARTKDLDSFETKVDLPEKEQKYKNISEITDLTGIRIICFLQEDADRVCDRLTGFYDIDAENSVNKNEQLEPDQFGYRSRHFVVGFDKNRAALPENERYVGLRAEIQVRTILQHAWAAIDWKLRYKNASQTPQEIRRRVFRVSALLELADDEFSSLSQEVSNIRSSYIEKIASGDFQIALDRESIDLFLEKDGQLTKIVEHALQVGYAISPNPPRARDPYSGVLASAQKAELESIDALKKLIAPLIKKSDSRLKKVFDAWHIVDRPPKLVVSRAGLTRLAIALALPKEQAQKLIDALPFGEKLQKAVQEVIGQE